MRVFTTVSDMFPKRAVASVVGIGGMAGSIGGILFPIYSGKLLDHFQASGNITAGYAILFAFCGSAYLVAFGISHLLAPRFWPRASSRRRSRLSKRPDPSDPSILPPFDPTAIVNPDMVM